MCHSRVVGIHIISRRSAAVPSVAAVLHLALQLLAMAAAADS